MRIEAFSYPLSGRPVPDPWEEFICGGLTSAQANGIDGEEAGDPDAESLRAAEVEQAARDFEDGREQGLREGRAAETLRQQELLRQAESQGAEQAAKLANQFAAVRDSFLESMEHEVVKLALAIAARILRRESQTDPLFLVGAVRVALGQLASTLQVRLRVCASEAKLWEETMAHLPNLKLRPIVIPDDSMRIGDCILETEMGSVDLGVGPQLHRMESALFEEAPPKKKHVEADCEDRLAVLL